MLRIERIGSRKCWKRRTEAGSLRQKRKPPSSYELGGLDKAPGDDLLLHADAHYHRRGCVSLPSSGWDRVVPQRYVRQGEGGGSQTVELSRSRSQRGDVTSDVEQSTLECR